MKLFNFLLFTFSFVFAQEGSGSGNGSGDGSGDFGSGDAGPVKAQVFSRDKELINKVCYLD